MQRRFEIGFKISYLLFVLISFNVFFARHWYISYLSYVIVALGIAVGVMRLIHVKNYLNAGVFLLLSFVCSYILGALNSFNYGYIDNVKAVVWMSIQFFLIFAFDKNGDYSTEKNALFITFITYTFFCAVIALYMLFTDWTLNVLMDDLYAIRGGVYSRLYGCYTDPNYGAVFAVVSIVLSVYYLVCAHSIKTIVKIFLIINCVLEFLFLYFSGSRTGMLSFFFAFIVFSLMVCVKNKRATRNVFVGVGCLAILFFALIVFQSMLNKNGVVNVGGRSIDRILDGSFFSDSRIGIWGNAMELFKQHPVIGISFRNIFEYANENIPDTFCGYESMHSFLFDVLVSQGIIGVVIILLFFAWAVKMLIEKYKGISSYKEFVFMMTILVAIFVSMLTYSETFYMNTGGAFMFWYVLGYLVNYKEEETFEKSVNAELL